jgi:hypothetical protein
MTSKREVVQRGIRQLPDLSTLEQRLQPGMMTRFHEHESRFDHDASTLGGNSGSAVVDLETHQVIGRHFRGRYMDLNCAVALWRLAGDPLLRRAGVQFV